MQKILITLIGWVCAISLFAQAPRWVAHHPVSDDTYHGVGIAAMDKPDYVRIATDNALADIASQISTTLENTSFFHVVEVDGDARELFEDKIKNSMIAWLEGHKLVDSYQADGNYYVYYTLDKEEYQANAAKRQRQVVDMAMSYLRGAQEADANMDLSQSLQLYSKGLKAVEPWLFMDLRSDGINLPVELYKGYLNVFGGLSLTANVTQVKGQPFQPIAQPIAGCLSKNGEVVPNVKLKARFATGGGDLSAPTVTDYNGTAEFYVKTISSKESIQELVIELDDSFFASLPKSYREMLKSKALPAAKVMIVLENKPVTAFLFMSEKNDLKGFERPMRSLFGNQHFTLVEDPDAAQLFVEISSIVEMGNPVTGGTYDLNTCLCTLHVKVYNNVSQELLLDYTVDQHKVLVPVDKSSVQSMQMCVREVLKRAKRELPASIKKIDLH